MQGKKHKHLRSCGCNFSALVVFPPLKKGRWRSVPWLHPLRVITVANNPTMTPSPNSFKNQDEDIDLALAVGTFVGGLFWLLICCSSQCVYMKSLCVALVMGGRPFVWLAYTTAMCLLDSLLVPQWPDAVMSPRAQTVAYGADKHTEPALFTLLALVICRTIVSSIYSGCTMSSLICSAFHVSLFTPGCQ